MIIDEQKWKISSTRWLTTKREEKHKLIVTEIWRKGSVSCIGILLLIQSEETYMWFTLITLISFRIHFFTLFVSQLILSPSCI